MDGIFRCLLDHSNYYIILYSATFSLEKNIPGIREVASNLTVFNKALFKKWLPYVYIRMLFLLF